MKAPRSRQEATSGALPLSKRGRLERAARLVEGVAQLLRRGRAAGGGADRAALGDQRLAGVGGDVDRVAVGGVDDRAEQLAAADRVRARRPPGRRRRRAPVRAPPSAAAGCVEGEDEHRRLVADPERLQPAAQLGRLDAARRAPRRGRRRRAAARSRGRPGGASARARRRRPPAAGSAARSRRGRRSRGRSPPRPGAARRRARSPGGRAPGRRPRDGRGRRGGRRRRGPSASSRIASIASAESWRRKPRPASRSPRPSRIADGAADRGGDRRRDLLQAALLEDQPLEPPLDGDAALQHLVLLVDEAGEGLLGDRDERRRVGHLEEREVALLGLLDQRLRQLARG